MIIIPSAFGLVLTDTTDIGSMVPAEQVLP
jgi:hypothetical protein